MTHNDILNKWCKKSFVHKIILSVRNHVVSPYKGIVKRNINECNSVFEDLKSAIHIIFDRLLF